MSLLSDYWTDVLTIYGSQNLPLDKIRPYLLSSKSCSIPLKARGPDSLKNIVLRNIHLNLCIKVKLNHYATYYDFSRAESVIRKLVLPITLKQTLLVHAQNCPIHGRTIFEKSNTYRNGRVYIIRNSKLDQLLTEDKRVHNDYLDRYHRRQDLYTILGKLYPLQEYQKNVLIPMILESVKFSNKFI